VVAVNKWDAVEGYACEQFKRSLETRLIFLAFAATHFISAKKRQGLSPVWDSILGAYKAAFCKMPTPLLTRLLLESVQYQQPKKVGVSRPKLRYAHQGGMNPPVIVIHGNALDSVTDSYRRFLEGRFRKAFKLIGTPLRLQMKAGANPFAQSVEKT
jgi:GTP-binding protein